MRGFYRSALDARVAVPDRPDLVLVRGCAVVGGRRGRESPGGPTELHALLGRPALEDSVQHAADRAVAAADAVEDADGPRLGDVELTVAVYHHAPDVLVDADDLTQRGGDELGVREAGTDPADHLLEGRDLVGETGAAGFGAFDAEAELEVLLVADEDVALLRDLCERLAQLGLATLPERGPVVHVHGDRRAVRLRGAREREAELLGVRRQRSDQAGHVQDLHALGTEQRIEVEVLDVEVEAHLARTVVPHARSTTAVAGVGDVELVPVPPGAALRKVRTAVRHVAGPEIGLDERGDGTARDELRAQVEALRPDVEAVARAIHSEPETADEEHRAVARLVELFAGHGFMVDAAPGDPTAFVARAGSGGTTVAVCLEYDALPELGHACGHNLISGAGALAALSLASRAEDLGLTVLAVGCPAEERGGGKIPLIAEGVFDDVDLAIMIHTVPDGIRLDPRGTSSRMPSGTVWI